MGDKPWPPSILVRLLPQRSIRCSFRMSMRQLFFGRVSVHAVAGSRISLRSQYQMTFDSCHV